ncbi:hypothetical protein D027_3627B, partial [Vibrio parahaemolyticus 861]
VIWGI